MQISYRQKVTYLAMLAGATVGALGAQLWLEYLADHPWEENAATQMNTGDVARIGMAAFALIRQINEMTQPAPPPEE